MTATMSETSRSMPNRAAFTDRLRMVFADTWSGLGLIVVIEFLLMALPVLSVGRGARAILIASDPGSGFLVMLLAANTALLIWRRRPPSRRHETLTLPVGRTLNQLLDVGTGMLLVLSAALSGWYLGLAFTAYRVPLDADFLLGFLPHLEWAPYFLAILNGYLLVSIVGLVSERPYQHFLITTLILATFVFAGMWVTWMPFRVLTAPLLPPWGIAGGLGISVRNFISNFYLEPAEGGIALWTVLLLVSNIWAASRHVER